MEGALRARSSPPGSAPAAPGCVISCPHDVIGYDHEAGRLQAVPPRGGARPRQLHPRREGLHLAAPGPAPASGRGSPRPTSTSSPATATTTRSPASTATSCSPGPATTWSTRWARTAAWCRRILIWAMDEGYIDAALTSFLEGDGRRLEGHARRRHQPRRGPRPAPAAATPTRPTPSPSTRPSSGASRSWRWSA